MRFVIRILGALLNRIRGGLWKEYLPSNKIYFPLFLGIIAGYDRGLGLEGGICTAIAAYLGQQIIGWGAYIGALTVGAKPAPENEMIDDIINSAKLTYKGKVYYLTNYPRLWGFAGLLLRGFVWSFPIGLAVNKLSVILCGGLMPFCYLIPTLILCKTKYNSDKTAWNVGELIWGSVLSAFVIC